jgi:aldehyde:ferredoxin oxidoreductase
MFNVGRYTKYMEDWMRMKNALGLCSVYTFFNIMSGGHMAALYSAAAGFPVGPYELMQRGERISNLAKALNAQRGFTRADDRIPDLWFRPMKSPEGAIEMQDYFKTQVLTRDDTEKMLDDYYQERGWGLSDGNPAGETLKALGLERWAPATDHR